MERTFGIILKLENPAAGHASPPPEDANGKFLREAVKQLQVVRKYDDGKLHASERPESGL